MSKRWHVIVMYRQNAEAMQRVDCDIEELSELEEIVERGPHWGTIRQIVVTYNGDATTVEEAAAA